jgi:hypothetical protein
MEEPYILTDSHIDNEKILQHYFLSRKKSADSYFDEISYRSTAEIGKNFFGYLKRFNLSGDKNLFVLPTANHYYYDKRELRRVRTVINLRKLNLIDDIDTFLKTIFQFLPPTAKLVGCFSDNRNVFVKEGFFSGLSERLSNLLDLRTVHYLDKNTVYEVLERHGFKVVDMTEIDGLTYFISQSTCQPLRIRA